MDTGFLNPCAACTDAGQIPATLELRIVGHPANVASVRRAIESLAGNHGFSAAAVADIGLCVNEAVANVIRHAYGDATDQPILVKAEVRDGAIRISIRDWGKGVDPEELPQKPYDPLTPGGVGLICLRRLMDEVVFTRQEPGMLLTLLRRTA